MKYHELENEIRAKAKSISTGKKVWTPAEVSQLLSEIADSIAAIRHSRESGIDATMGLRSGSDLDI